MIIDYKVTIQNAIVVSFISTLEIKHLSIFIKTAGTEARI